MNKITLGIVSFVPLVLFIVSLGLVIAGTFVSRVSNAGAGAIAIVAAIGVLASVVLAYTAMMHLLGWACGEASFKDDLQAWVLIFYFLGMLIYPFFWWTYIRPQDEKNEEIRTERTWMSPKDAKLYAFLPLECAGLYMCFVLVGTILARAIPATDMIVALILFIMLGALSIYIVWVEAKFLVEVANNSSLNISKKTLWAMFFYVFNLFVFPVYWLLHMRSNEEEMSKEEKASIRERNREFTRAKRKEEYEQKIEGLSQGRLMDIFAILPGAVLIFAILLMVYWTCIATAYDGPIYVILSGMRILLIGSGLIAVGLYLISLWADARHRTKDKIMWSISLTLFNILLIPVYWNKYLRNKSELLVEKQRKHLGLLSVLPFICFAIFMILGNSSMDMLTGSLILEVVFILATVFLVVSYLFSLLVFSVKVLDNQLLSIVKKIGWIVALLLFGVIAAPLYFGKYVFKEKREVKEYE